MPVRNLHSLGNTKPIPVFFWIPPTNGCEYKVTIERKDGTVDDITEILHAGSWSDSINDVIGGFSFIIDNSGENFTDIWKGNEIIRIYSDYETTATTLRFRGRIEKVSYPNQTIRITGRSEGLDLLNLLVTYSTTAETSEIVNYLFSTFTTKFTTTNVNTSTVTMEVNWYQKPFLECILELCNKSGFDFYVDCNLDAHYFEYGSVKNITEAVVHDLNILSIDDFGNDYSLIKNKVTVQGVCADLPVLWTVSSTDSSYGINSELGVRHKIISDEGINSITQAQIRAEAELIVGLEPNAVGEAEVLPLATIQPGEQIRISAPHSNIPPQYYTITSYEHDIVNYKTKININKIPLNVQNIIKRTKLWGALEAASKPSSYTESNTEMEYSWNFDFTNNSGTHANTVVSGGFLRTNGATSGIWESDFNDIDSNVTAAVMRVNGETLSSVKIFVSFNGGATYRQIYGGGVPAVQSIPSGSSLKIRVYFSSAETQIKGLALLYK